MALKQNNIHRFTRPTHCADCGRMLPKRAYRSMCAGCIKGGQGKPAWNDWDEARWAIQRRERTARA